MSMAQFWATKENNEKLREELTQAQERIRELGARTERYKKYLEMISGLGARENVFPRELGELADKALSDKEK